MKNKWEPLSWSSFYLLSVFSLMSNPTTEISVKSNIYHTPRCSFMHTIIMRKTVKFNISYKKITIISYLAFLLQKHCFGRLRREQEMALIISVLEILRDFFIPFQNFMHKLNRSMLWTPVPGCHRFPRVRRTRI